MKIIRILALMLSLLACTSQEIKSVEYYEKNPKEANKVSTRCFFARSEENPKNCDNAFKAKSNLLNKVTKDRSNVLSKRARNSKNAFSSQY